MRFTNDITAMSCQHNRLSPRSSLDNRGFCLSCGTQPEADTSSNTGNFEMPSMLRLTPTPDMQGVIYK